MGGAIKAEFGEEIIFGGVDRFRDQGGQEPSGSLGWGGRG